MKTIFGILNNLRLGAFALAYGLTGALVGGTLNRVMLADLQISPAIVGLFFAVPLLISPVRVWVGYRSDGFPIMGLRREPYVILGALLTGVSVIVATVLALQLASGAAALTVGVLLAFILYGFGRNMAHNTMQALLADRFEGDARARAITAFEVTTLLGLVVGAGGLGRAFEVFDPARLVSVTMGAMVVVFVLSLIAAVRSEPRTGFTQEATEKAREIPFRKVLNDVVLADKQVRLFFLIILLTFVGTLAQDVFLEPYGALVLGMEVGDTTRLTATWGVGVMIAMIASGAFLIKWLGYMTVMRIGIVASTVVFVGVIASGMMGSAGMFRSLVFVMGLGTGLAGAGMLTGIINFTTAVRAGLLMGVWGVANQLGRAVGSLMGGTVVEAVQRITDGNAFAAYAAVFALEVVILIAALALTARLNIAESRITAEAGNLLPAVEGAMATT